MGCLTFKEILSHVYLYPVTFLSSDVLAATLNVEGVENTVFVLAKNNWICIHQKSTCTERKDK